MEPGGAPSLTVKDIEDARLLLRRSDAMSRREGLEMIDGWGRRHPDADAARQVLRAMTLAYPRVGPRQVDPAVRFGRLLFGCPRAVAVAEVEAAYLLSAERVRRVLLHLLALRRDTSGVAALGHLIGADGPQDLLPLPTTGLLSPVLDVVSAPELVPALVHVSVRPGWTWHAVDLLEQMVVDGRVDVAASGRIVEGLGPVVEELTATCDRATAVGDATVDAARVARFRLRCLVSLFLALAPVDESHALKRVLASADPRVSVIGAVALVRAGRAVAPERLELLARDPEALAELFDGFAADGDLRHVPSRWRTGRARAEAELVRWLAGETELATAPDEIEHVGTVAAGGHPDDGAVHLFRFRLRAPHWSCARGWMIGAAGPFRDDGAAAVGVEPFASSVYSAEDDDELDGHLDAILEELGAWSDTDDD